MDFYGRQEEARRASRWLVVAFAVAVLLVVVAVNFVVLSTIMVWTPGSGVGLISFSDWLGAHPATVWVTTLVTAGSIVGPSLRKVSQLQAGGKVVALDLGARLVTGDASDPLLRRLRNVVEEMAIAASVPVPSVYVLESGAMNALAAGYLPSTASLVVTRGALLALDRAELQGVIGHEFSHILNGDMRLNTRLVGFLHGLFIVSAFGRWLGPGSGSGRVSGGRSGGVLGSAGIAFFVIGLTGLFVGRLLQAAVARQRERLADASAVQFTRESRGLRNALVKVGSHRFGSRLDHHGIDRVSHMLFASAGIFDFATHPPLVERIRALDPTFKTTEFGKMRYVLDAREAEAAGTSVAEPVAEPNLPGDCLNSSVAADASTVAALVGNPASRHVQFAEGIRNAMPEAVNQAARDPEQAQWLLVAISIGSRERDERLAFVRQQLGERADELVRKYLVVADSLPLIQRLPAVLVLMGPLRQLPVADRHQLIAVINGLSSRAGAPSIFGYALRKSALSYLQEVSANPRVARILPMRAASEDLRVVLGVLARCGADDDLPAIQQAFTAGWEQLQLAPPPLVHTLVAWVGPMDRALVRLDRLAPRDKERVVRALTVTIANDGRVNLAEAELLRLLCALLHCPLPPLL